MWQTTRRLGASVGQAGQEAAWRATEQCGIAVPAQCTARHPKLPGMSRERRWVLCCHELRHGRSISGIVCRGAVRNAAVVCKVMGPALNAAVWWHAVYRLSFSCAMMRQDERQYGGQATVAGRMTYHGLAVRVMGWRGEGFDVTAGD